MAPDETVNILFDASKSLGLEFHGPEVTRVIEGAQSARLGVRAGWRVISVVHEARTTKITSFRQIMEMVGEAKRAAVGIALVFQPLSGGARQAASIVAAPPIAPTTPLGSRLDLSAANAAAATRRAAVLADGGSDSEAHDHLGDSLVDVVSSYDHAHSLRGGPGDNSQWSADEDAKLMSLVPAGEGAAVEWKDVAKRVYEVRVCVCGARSRAA